MTEQDTVQYLKTIAAIYPAFQVTREHILAWSKYMTRYQIPEATKALDLYVTQSKSEFAPSISQIVGIIREQVTPQRKVFKAIDHDNSTREERIDYVNRIKEQYPDLFAGSTRTK